MDRQKFKKTYSIIDSIQAQQFDKTDILGSYTGVPADGDTPTQDADDLQIEELIKLVWFCRFRDLLIRFWKQKKLLGFLQKVWELFFVY